MYGATISLSDITIDPNIPLSDLSGTNHFYALPSTLNEYYPNALNVSLCKDLTLTNLPPVTSFDDFFQGSLINKNFGIPSATDLATKFLNGGNPVVIKGQTLTELANAANL